MISAYSGSRIRAAEAPLLAAGLGPALMARAAFGLAAAVVTELRTAGRRIYGSRVCLLVGSGNNGGDALFAGAILAGRGVHTTAILTGTRTHPEALDRFRDRGGRAVTLEAATVDPLALLCLSADLVIDGILGTGSAGGLREPAASLIRRLQSGTEGGDAPGPRPRVVACDLPSGVDPDTGTCAAPVLSADLTVTFGGAKIGLLAGPGALAAGRLQVVDIGLGERTGLPELVRLIPRDLAALWPVPGPKDHKYSRGVLGIIAGSHRYPGAALLAVDAALAAGVGMVRYLGPEDVARLVAAHAPEAVCSQDSVAESRVQAWLAGPGAVGDSGQESRIAAALESGLPVVVDAGALEAVSPQRHLGPHHILTPHAGELSALLARFDVHVARREIEQDPFRWVRRAAELTGATVLLKGSVTLVAAPSGPVFSQAEATPWMAAAGSGDTLSGILGSLAATLAEKAEPVGLPGVNAEARWAVAAAMAAAVHGMAGTTAAGGAPLRAGDIARAVPATVARILASGARR